MMYILGIWAALVAGNLQDEVDRLIGHEVTIQGDGYSIDRIANEAKPLVGCVHRKGSQLIFRSGSQEFLLRGPLAIPRIAGPDYKIWIVGTHHQDGSLTARRLGILAPPARSGCTNAITD